jgi:hypothetical protein
MKIKTKYYPAFVIFLLITYSLKAQNIFTEIFSEDKIYFDSLLANQDHDIQIIFTQIDRDKNNIPKFTTHRFNVDCKKYFYPASTVKLPACILALEKLNRLNICGLDKFTSLRIDSTYKNQSGVLYDSSSSNKFASVANYIKKILLVSDNDAFNRLYEFIGQKEFNESLWERGFKNVKINSRLAFGFSEEDNRHTNKFIFFKGDNIIYEQPAQYSDLKFDFQLINLKRGKGYYSGEKLINEPKDFSGTNYFSLEEQHEMIKRLFFPNSFEPSLRFKLSLSDYEFIYKYMSMLPKESEFDEYKNENYWDSYVKFFIFGDSKDTIPQNIRIFNKVGEAYGFLIDNAYIVDFANSVEFILSAVIHVNKDKIYNDDKYDYDEIGFPFLAKLGRIIYSHELNRQKKIKPDLNTLFEITNTNLLDK